MRYQAPTGTQDLLPMEILRWQSIETTLHRVFSLYNYQEIRTPIFESIELFRRSIGKTTDIIKKEMYTFRDRGGKTFALRPEETAGVVRAALENNLIGEGRLTKLYYIGPMFRAERPQAGRFRQFHQAGVETFGSSSPLLDVEMIILTLHLFEELGLKNLETHLNSVGCPKCRPEFHKKLKEYLKGKIAKLCPDCRRRAKLNPLRIFDCKVEKCQKYVEAAPRVLDSLCEECSNHFGKVSEHLKNLDIDYKLNHRLVRGIDYYTKTTFEIIAGELGAQNAICGGGRYDNLVGDLGGPSIPAVGFAIGLERMLMVMGKQGIALPEEKPLTLFIATLGDAAEEKGFSLLREIRNAGISAEGNFLEKSLKAQMRLADHLKVQHVLIIGDNELSSGRATLRNMASSHQEEIAFAEIINRLRS